LTPVMSSFTAYMSLLAAATVAVAQPITWTETFLPYGSATLPLGLEYGPYLRDNPKRQHVHVLSTTSDKPTPVYVYAHGNGGTANMNAQELSKFAIAGTSVVSWESVTTVQGAEDQLACRSDLDLVRAWIETHAATYNLDPNRIIMGGRSRGSGISWGMAHSGKPEIIGLYMYNALPDPGWANGNTMHLTAVTAESPPAYLAYGPECPKPIMQDCVPSPKPTDIHNPRNGQKIVDRYKELGMENLITLTDGLENNNMGVYDLFPDFAASLLGTTTVTHKSSPSSGTTTSSNPSGATTSLASRILASTFTVLGAIAFGNVAFFC